MKPIGIAVWSAAALIGVAGIAQAGPAQNPNLPWTYVQGSYIKGDGDDFFESDAWELTGSLALSEIWHTQLSYLDGDSESDFFEDAEFDGYQVSVGVHPQITANTQFIADILYFDYDAEESNGDDDSAESDGFGFDVGLRHSIAERAEAWAKVVYVEGDIDEGGEGGDTFDFNDTSIQGGLRYNWNGNLSTGLTVYLDGGFGAGISDFSSGGDAAAVDVRWSFGGPLSGVMDSADGVSDSY